MLIRFEFFLRNVREPGEKTNWAKQREHAYLSMVSQPHMSHKQQKKASGKYMYGRRGNILAKKQRRTGKKDRGAGKKKRRGSKTRKVLHMGQVLLRRRRIVSESIGQQSE